MTSAAGRGTTSATSSAATAASGRRPRSFHARTSRRATPEYATAARADANASRRPEHSAQRLTGQAVGAPQRAQSGARSERQRRAGTHRRGGRPVLGTRAMPTARPVGPQRATASKRSRTPSRLDGAEPSHAAAIPSAGRRRAAGARADRSRAPRAAARPTGEPDCHSRRNAAGREGRRATPSTVGRDLSHVCANSVTNV